MDKTAGKLIQKTLGQGLGLPLDGYAIFQDCVTHLEYIRPCRELMEKGLYVELGGYQCHVFLDWRFVNSDEWRMVNGALNGAGVPSLQAKFDEMFATKAHPEQRRREEGISEKEEVKRKRSAKKPVPEKAAKKKAARKTKKPATKKISSRK
jgi:GH35 family endo-1,4-beta-xylanase